jgi:hypothetical protein
VVNVAMLPLDVAIREAKIAVLRNRSELQQVFVTWAENTQLIVRERLQVPAAV